MLPSFETIALNTDYHTTSKSRIKFASPIDYSSDYRRGSRNEDLTVGAYAQRRKKTLSERIPVERSWVAAANISSEGEVERGFSAQPAIMSELFAYSRGYWRGFTRYAARTEH